MPRAEPAAAVTSRQISMMNASDLRVSGIATAYQLFDVGYEIDLERVGALLGGDTRGRSVPARAEGRAFEIRQPPLSAALGERDITVDGARYQALLQVRFFDFGVCSLRLSVAGPTPCPWPEFVAFGNAFDASAALAGLFQTELQALLDRVRAAIERPRVAPVIEDYVVFRLHAIESRGVSVMASEALTDDHLVPLLLGERRGLSTPARRELLGNRFSYYADDLAVLTWDNALVVEPRADDQDVELVLEFANAQLLELRVYDALLDSELPALYDRIALARRRLQLSRTYRGLLGSVQARVADVTEIVERAENAFKVTDDVYLARIYEKALELFRERSWRSGISRKLAIFRETYEMLNGEAQAARAELLELAIVLLIVFEIVLSFIR
jgi:hypothetical protein